MDYKILTSSSGQGLTTKIKELMTDGWKPVGSHQVVVLHSQNRFSGSQHMDTRHETEYSQTMIKNN